MAPLIFYSEALQLDVIHGVRGDQDPAVRCLTPLEMFAIDATYCLVGVIDMM